MNKTSPSFETPVTERELNLLVQTPTPSNGCCSGTKPAEQPKDSQPTAAKPSCCCH